MSGGAPGKGGGGGRKDEGERLIATNPVAYQNYFIQEVVEAGLVLTGTEVKSLRTAAPNLRDAYVEVRKGEAWLVNTHVAVYTHGNIWNHDTNRRRKLLLHKHQLKQLGEAIIQGGMTVIPTRIYFKQGRAKIELAVAKGKKKHDKRHTLKEKSAKREMDQALKHKRA